MRKNLKLILTLISVISCALINARVFSETVMPSASAVGTSNLIVAINELRNELTATIRASGNTINAQLALLFDDTFKGKFGNNQVIEPGTLDAKIKMYVENFYSWFALSEFTALNLNDKNAKAQESIGKLLAQDLQYNLEKNALEVLKDKAALLVQPVEGGGNDFDAKTLGFSLSGEVSPFGSLAMVDEPTINLPNVNDLVGCDGYQDQQAQDQAKLFISYIMQASPPPKTFHVPDKPASGNVILYLPVASKDRPYTELMVPKDQYEKMVAYLQKSKYFQEYKMKLRAVNVKRSLYAESMLRAYQERVKNLTASAEVDKLSLAENEAMAASYGLDKEYFDSLKKKSVADVNLEMLYAMNKLSYFLYKLHRDNERLSLVIATTGLQLAGQGLQDEFAYFKPLMAIIENQCWNVDGDDNADENKKSICKNPQQQALPTTSSGSI